MFRVIRLRVSPWLSIVVRSMNHMTTSLTLDFEVHTTVSSRILFWIREQRANARIVRHGCPVNPPLCDDLNKGNFTAYLNQEHIKSALDFPKSFTFRDTNFDLNLQYALSNYVFKTTTDEVAAILEVGSLPDQPLGDINLLVLQGNDDYMMNTPGQRWMYDNLRWSGQADYRIAKWKTLDEEEFAATGFWKGTADGRLVFVAVDGAGHMVPGDVGEGSWRVMQRWLDGGWKA